MFDDFPNSKKIADVSVRENFFLNRLEPSQKNGAFWSPERWSAGHASCSAVT